MADIETATISETAASNNAASPNGMPEGMAPSGVNDSWRENVAAQKRLWDRDHVTISSTGSDPTYVLTYLTAPTAYINGGRYAFRASFGNAGSASANVNALGSKTINQHASAGLAVLAGGEIKTAHHVTLEYDSTADVLVVVSPTPASSGSLGTIASQNANNVTITGGSITGITDLAVADGGTGRSTLTNHGVLIGQGTSAINQTAAGTAGQVLTSNGASADPTFQTAVVGAGTTYSNYVLLTSGATWSVPAGVTTVKAILQAGGGGGGGANRVTTDTRASGGQAGATVTAIVAVSGSVSYSIGAAGTAGSNSPGNGGSGGDTTFGTITAKGGPGGKLGGDSIGATAAIPALSALAPTSSAVIIGAYLNQVSTASASAGVGGNGGTSLFGTGGTGGNGAGSAPAAANYGAGGGGAGESSNGQFHAGGAGLAGCIVILY